MRTSLKPLLSLCLITLIVSGALLIPTPGGSAQAQIAPCQITVFKEAEGSGDLRFSFTGFIDDVEVLQGDPEAGEQFSQNFNPGATYLVVENPTEGWTLDDIVCEGDGFGFNFDTENAVEIVCFSQTPIEGSCTFTNVRQSGTRNVPTLSEWGMISAAVGLGLIGVFFAVRRKKMQDA